MSANEFCIRVCKPGGRDAQFCQHIYGMSFPFLVRYAFCYALPHILSVWIDLDVMGCSWNMPGNYGDGFDTCEGDRCVLRVEIRTALTNDSIAACKKLLLLNYMDAKVLVISGPWCSPMGLYPQPDGSTSTFQQVRVHCYKKTSSQSPIHFNQITNVLKLVYRNKRWPIVSYLQLWVSLFPCHLPHLPPNSLDTNFICTISF